VNRPPGHCVPGVLFILILLVGPALANESGKALHRSAVANDIGKVNTLLDAGIDVNAHNRFGKTTLMYAAEEGHNEVV